MVITMKEINKGKLGIVMEVSSYEIIIKLRYKEVKRSWQHIPERERERERGRGVGRDVPGRGNSK